MKAQVEKKKSEKTLSLHLKLIPTGILQQSKQWI